MHTHDDVIRLSASDLVNHLSCRHLTRLNAAVAVGEMEPPSYHDPFLELLQKRGTDHEEGYIQHLKVQGLEIVRIDGDTLEDLHVKQTVAAMRRGVEVIVQGALAHGRWCGRADILRRVDAPSRQGGWSYEVYDTKLSRETKGGTILQLSLYSDLVDRIQGRRPEQMYVVVPWTDYQAEPVPHRRLRSLLPAGSAQPRAGVGSGGSRRYLPGPQTPLRHLPLATSM